MLKIGLIGAGSIAANHVTALKLFGAQIVGVCTRGQSGQVFGQQHSIPYFSSIQQLCETARPDGLLLLTQPSSYEDCLKHLQPFDLPVLVEKPLGYTSVEAENLIRWLPKQVMVSQNRRFYSNLKPIRDLLRTSGPLSVHAFVCERAKDIGVKPVHDRNHWHVMNAIHMVDLLKNLFGKPKQYHLKKSWGKAEFTQLPIYQSTWYESEPGHKVQFNSNFDSAGGWRIHVFSPACEMTVFPMERTMIKKVGAPEVEAPLDPLDLQCKQGFAFQAQTFLSGLKTPGQLPPEWVSFEDALSSIRMTEELYQSDV